eukprot:gene27380-36147_t
MEEDSFVQEGRDFFGEYSEIEGGDGSIAASNYSVQSDRDSVARENKLVTVLLQDTNKLLSAVGIGGKQVLSYNELCRVSSSLFVAVFEALFNIRIDGINRNPRSQTDYIRNAQLVIDALSERVLMNLDHIKGAAIVAGDYRTLSDLVKLLLRIESISIPDNSPRSSIETRESIRDVVGTTSVTRPNKDSDMEDDDELQHFSAPSSPPHRTLSSVGSGNPTQLTKQQAADQRRVRLALLSDVRRREQNIRTALQSHRILRDRDIADQVRDTQAFCMRRSSREQATVREEKLRGRLHREQNNCLSSLVARNSWEDTLRIYPGNNGASTGTGMMSRDRTSNPLSQSFPLSQNNNHYYHSRDSSYHRSSGGGSSSSSKVGRRRGRSTSRSSGILIRRNKDLGQGAYNLSRRSHSLA